MTDLFYLAERGIRLARRAQIGLPTASGLPWSTGFGPGDCHWQTGRNPPCQIQNPP